MSDNDQGKNQKKIPTAEGVPNEETKNAAESDSTATTAIERGIEKLALSEKPESGSKAANLQKLLSRHPLHCRWTLWYIKGDRSMNWEGCLKQVAVLDTIEDFWALYNHIQPASSLELGSAYYFFKEGIKPMWEDEDNVRGGRWLIVVDKQKRAQELDHYWFELLMAIIGEQFEEHGEDICGAAVDVRYKGDRVSLWTRDSEKDDVNLRIGQILKAKLQIPDSVLIRYQVHKESPVLTGLVVQPRLMIPAKKTEDLQN